MLLASFVFKHKNQDGRSAPDRLLLSGIYGNAGSYVFAQHVSTPIALNKMLFVCFLFHHKNMPI